MLKSDNDFRGEKPYEAKKIIYMYAIQCAPLNACRLKISLFVQNMLSFL